MGEPRNLLASPGPFFRIPAATVVAIFSLELETEAAVVLEWKYLSHYTAHTFYRHSNRLSPVVLQENRYSIILNLS